MSTCREDVRDRRQYWWTCEESRWNDYFLLSLSASMATQCGSLHPPTNNDVAKRNKQNVPKWAIQTLHPIVWNSWTASPTSTTCSFIACEPTCVVSLLNPAISCPSLPNAGSNSLVGFFFIEFSGRRYGKIKTCSDLWWLGLMGLMGMFLVMGDGARSWMCSSNVNNGVDTLKFCTSASSKTLHSSRRRESQKWWNLLTWFFHLKLSFDMFFFAWEC